MHRLKNKKTRNRETREFFDCHNSPRVFLTIFCLRSSPLGSSPPNGACVSESVLKFPVGLTRRLGNVLPTGRTGTEAKIVTIDGSQETGGLFHVKHPVRISMKPSLQKGSADKADTLQIAILIG